MRVPAYKPDPTDTSKMSPIMYDSMVNDTKSPSILCFRAAVIAKRTPSLFSDFADRVSRELQGCGSVGRLLVDAIRSRSRFLTFHFSKLQEGTDT
jgi:hypothetical protein